LPKLLFIDGRRESVETTPDPLDPVARPGRTTLENAAVFHADTRIGQVGARPGFKAVAHFSVSTALYHQGLACH